MLKINTPLIRAEMKKRGWNEAEMARRMGLRDDARTSVYYFLSNPQRLTLRTVRRFATALNCDPISILEDNNQ